MDHLQFCYWLQGYFEIGKPETLDKEQVQEIKNHLALVFRKVTPDTGVGDYIFPPKSGYYPLRTLHTGDSSKIYC